MTPIRIAVVGAGHLGRIHARILAGLEAFTLIGVVDPLEKQRRQVAAEYHTSAFAHHNDVLDHVDAVVVATPTSLHRQVAADFLRRGKHVFVEKPIATSAQEADELVRLAQRQRVQLQVGHVERFNPAFQAARPHLDEPKYIEAIRRGGYTFRSTDIGVVLDLMIHDLDLVLALVGSPVRKVDALGVSIFGKHEDAANARIEFDNGCVATLSACRASHTAARTMQAWTTSGFVALDFQARTASVIRPSDELVERSLDLNALTTEQKQRLLADHLPVEALPVVASDAITAELNDFAESVRAGRAPRVTGEAGRDAVAVAEMILEQIATHAWNGESTGPIGPLLEPSPNILTGPHWQRHLTPGRMREAG